MAKSNTEIDDRKKKGEKVGYNRAPVPNCAEIEAWEGVFSPEVEHPCDKFDHGYN